MNRLRSSSVTRNEFSQCALVEIIHLHDCLRGALQEIQKVVNSLVEYSSTIDDQIKNNDREEKSYQRAHDENRNTIASNAAAIKVASINNSNMKIKQKSELQDEHFVGDSCSRNYVNESDLNCNNHDGDGDKKIRSSLIINNSITSQSYEATEKKTFDVSVASNLSDKVASRFHLIWSVFQAHSQAEDECIWPTLKVKLADLQPSTCSQNHQSDGKGCCVAALFGQEEYEEDHAEEEAMFQQINSTLRRLKGSFRFYHASNHSTQSDEKALYIIRQVILLLKEQIDNLVKHLKKHLEKEETECLPFVKKHLTNDEISAMVGEIMGKRSAEVMTKILNLALCTLPAEEQTDMVGHMKNAMEGTFFQKWLEMGGWDGGKAASTSSSGSSALSGEKRKISTLSEDEMKKATYSHARINTTTNAHNAASRHPTKWYKQNKEGNICLVWDCSDPQSTNTDILESIPDFTDHELIPTYRFSSTQGGPVLGCNHYARSCKLRHPVSGTLHTCRLCFQELRESSSTSQFLCPPVPDLSSQPNLDRNAVSEVLCMRCGTLQPAAESCINPDCYPKKKFARHFCSICKLYDDAPSKDIYHCPYCNACRKGKGLGIDFRHCMRCNACVAIDEYEGHACIPKRLEGMCPICKEDLFESTEKMRSLKCGHVMHLSCFNSYMLNCSSYGKIKCPLCNMVCDTLRG